MEIHEQSKLQAKKGPVCERGEKQTGQSGSLRGKTDGTMRTAALGRWGYQRHAYFEGGGGQKFQKLPKKFQKFLVASVRLVPVPPAAGLDQQGDGQFGR